MVFERRGDHALQWAAGVSIAGQFRMPTETLRSWVRPAESMTVADGDDNGEACAGQVAQRRIGELGHADELLKAASAFLHGSSPASAEGAA